MEVRHTAVARVRARGSVAETVLVAGFGLVAAVATAVPVAWVAMLALGVLGAPVPFRAALPVGMVAALVPFAAGSLLRGRSQQGAASHRDQP